MTTMLLLTTVEMTRFRSMASTVQLGVNDEITVLTGENGGGKSATLYGIEALLGNRELDHDDICTAPRDRPSLREPLPTLMMVRPSKYE